MKHTPHKLIFKSIKQFKQNPKNSSLKKHLKVKCLLFISNFLFRINSLNLAFKNMKHFKKNSKGTGLVDKIKQISERSQIQKDLASAEFWFNQNKSECILLIA